MYSVVLFLATLWPTPAPVVPVYPRPVVVAQPTRLVFVQPYGWTRASASQYAIWRSQGRILAER